MSHHFESGFFVSVPAWHHLGTILDAPPTTSEAIVQAGLDWEVLEEPIYQVDEKHSEVTLSKKLKRDRDLKVLATVKHDYRPLQNQEAFRWFEPLIESGGVELEAAGSLKEGKRIWILAKLTGADTEILQGDAVRPYLLLHNSHDGSTAVWLQFTPVRVVCWNTLNGAARNRFGDLWQKKAICIPHNQCLQEQLGRLHNLLSLTRREFDLSVEEYKLMAHQELTEELVRQYLGMVLGTRTPSKHPAWSQLMANFESGRGNQGKTLWDAYNAVTEWLEHQRWSDPQARLDSNWFGSSARWRAKAHQAAIAIVESEAAQYTQHSKLSHTKSRESCISY